MGLHFKWLGKTSKECFLICKNLGNSNRPVYSYSGAPLGAFMPLLGLQYSAQIPYGPQSLRHLLSDPLQRRAPTGGLENSFSLRIVQRKALKVGNFFMVNGLQNHLSGCFLGTPHQKGCCQLSTPPQLTPWATSSTPHRGGTDLGLSGTQL